ncbi:46 kDa FK506-binding nuclear protein-like isoform X3 [Asterias rubens]|uniref:46 kDa FK506-binding nuclear protein-like isoform X3 n=1 Tax=Asterias rubens TaxID=7604 RepID=UPI0014553E17|nr:46 kDa FK506-binding nuclear protein-like isoform X3 [Asterias rubens]
MFWGLTIEPGKHYTQTVDESFHVSMAALETRDVASPERDKVKMTQLMVQHDKAEFLVCTLSYASNIFQQYLDLNFTEGEEVTFFSEGRATIHLTGYLVRDEPMSMDPDMMSMDEASSSDEAASNSEDEEEAEDDDDDDVDEGGETEMSLQQLAMGDIEDEDDDDDDIEEWKPKDGKIKRKKQQKMTNAKRQHVDMVEEFEPRKAKKVAELEISKSEPDGSDDDEGDDDYSPVSGAAEDAEEDVEDEEEEEEDSDDFIGWDLEEGSDEDEDEDEDSDEDVDALYDEEDSDYDEDVKDLETALKSLRSKSETQLKTRSTEKKKRVLRARETTPPKIKTSPRKSASKTPDAGNKENIDRPIKQLGSSPAKQSAKEIKTPAALKKTPAGKTLGTPKEGTKTQAGKVTSKPDTPAVGSPGGNAEARQSPRGKTPVRKPELKTPSGKTPASAAAVVDTPGKTPAAKGKAGSTPGKVEGKTPKGKGNETKTPNTQKGKGDAVKTPAAKSAKKESGAKKQLVKTPLKVKLRTGTTLEDVVIGDGKLAKSGKMVFVYYKGLLNNGEEFDSCLKGKPFLFRLGNSEVIKGWDEGIAGMKVGGKRKLTIPPSQGYGSRRAGRIPPSSTLTFDVQLVNVK